MLIGHAGIAQLAKWFRRDLSLHWLLTAAFLPDLVRLPLGLVAEPYWREMLSHSLPAVALLATAISISWVARAGTLPAAAVLFLACLAHWPADAWTGCKPLYPGRWVGRFGYRYPIADLAFEGSLFLAGWLLLRGQGTLPRARKYVVPISSMVLQICFLLSLYVDSEVFIGRREWLWYPRSAWLPRERPVERLGCHPPAA